MDFYTRKPCQISDTRVFCTTKPELLTSRLFRSFLHHQACQEILDEFAEKLRVKFKFSEEITQTAVAEILRFFRVVEISGTLKTVPANPDDDRVVECAVRGQATHIVTGDKHLLTLVKYQNIDIVKAADFIVLLPSS